MSIQDKIEEVRRKPEHVRIRYAWVLAIILTFVVVIIWIISLVGNRSIEEGSESMSPDAGSESTDVKQDNSLKDAASSPQGNWKKAIDNSGGSSEGFSAQ